MLVYSRNFSVHKKCACLWGWAQILNVGKYQMCAFLQHHQQLSPCHTNLLKQMAVSVSKIVLSMQQSCQQDCWKRQ